MIANFQVSRLSNVHYDDVRQKQDRYRTSLLGAAMAFLDRLRSSDWWSALPIHSG